MSPLRLRPGALFAAMARGMIGLASPISATGVLVPVIYGLARGESPNVLQLLGGALAIGGVLLAVRPARATERRPPRRDGLSVLFAAVAALGFGALDVLGSSLYAVATSIGRVGLVAVEASLYPVVTVSLAARLVHEHLGRSQRAGVALTLSGIAAIAAGS